MLLPSKHHIFLFWRRSYCGEFQPSLILSHFLKKFMPFSFILFQKLTLFVWFEEDIQFVLAQVSFCGIKYALNFSISPILVECGNSLWFATSKICSLKMGYQWKTCAPWLPSFQTKRLGEVLKRHVRIFCLEQHLVFFQIKFWSFWKKIPSVKILNFFLNFLLLQVGKHLFQILFWLGS